ncbi:MAG: proline--tRNA ligase, partial [Hadesarchaea archaeon]|nr:proline--tRNA ligase [Hadesarchaea archaeon]
ESYQIVNIFRHETKATKPLIRLREVTTFKEAHTAHDTEEGAKNQVEEGLEIYKEFFNELGIPHVITKRPSWDTFAGAEYSIAFDMLTPNGKSLQIGTVHNLGQNFSKVFDLTFETPEGDQDYVYQTCYGISDRVIAAVIIMHGDDRGPCFPPKVAPIQTVVVPVPFKEEDIDVIEGAKKIQEKLNEAGFRTHLDDRDLRPGDKYYRWERRGVPIRIEIGPKELKNNEVTLVRRDTGEKTTIPKKSLIEEINDTFEKIKINLKERAEKYLENKIQRAENLEEVKEIMNENQGIARIYWCGQEDCGQEIEDETGGDVLGPEFENDQEKGKCIICGGKGGKSTLVSKTY